MIYGGDITKSIFARLEVLEKAQAEYKEQKRIEKLMHEPYMVLKQWSLLDDEYILEYYPEGRFQEPEILNNVTWKEITQWVLLHDANMACQISMSSSIEWLYVFNRFGESSKKYTEEQHKRMTERWLTEYPKLMILHYTDEGRKIVETMNKLPQESMIRLGVLQKVLRGE